MEEINRALSIDDLDEESQKIFKSVQIFLQKKGVENWEKVSESFFKVIPNQYQNFYCALRALAQYEKLTPEYIDGIALIRIPVYFTTCIKELRKISQDTVANEKILLQHEDVLYAMQKILKNYPSNILIDNINLLMSMIEKPYAIKALAELSKHRHINHIQWISENLEIASQISNIFCHTNHNINSWMMDKLVSLSVEQLDSLGTIVWLVRCSKYG